MFSFDKFFIAKTAFYVHDFSLEMDNIYLYFGLSLPELAINCFVITGLASCRTIKGSTLACLMLTLASGRLKLISFPQKYKAKLITFLDVIEDMTLHGLVVIFRG